MGLNKDRAQGTSKGRGSADSLIRSTDEEEPQKDTRKNKGGRPSTLNDPHRTTITLDKRHVNALKDIQGKIMIGGGDDINRSKMMRLLIDALIEADIDFENVETENDCLDLLTNKLSSP